MPEVHEAPQSEVILRNPQRAAGIEAAQNYLFAKTPDNLDVDEAEFVTRKFFIKETIKKNYPNLPEKTVELLESIYIGPGSLDEETLKHGTEDLAQKELSARIQQHYTHMILYGQQEGADPNYQETIHAIMKRMNSSSRTKLGKELQIKSFMNGIISEVAVIKTLTENGYVVYIPDYLQKSDKEKGVSSQTREWDVEAGIDLVAISRKGDIFLVDAKGRKFNDTSNESGSPGADDINSDSEVSITDRIGSLPDSLTDIINQESIAHDNPNPAIRRARIVIPTAEHLLGSVESKKENQTHQQALGQIGELDSDVKNSIIMKLENPNGN